MFRKILLHAQRISYQLGRRARFGDQRFKMPGYYASRLANSDEFHEIYMKLVFQRLLASRPGTFIDIGVNIGQTLVKILGIDRNRAYVGFEPQIPCCYNVEQFLKLNDLRNVTVLPIAISDSNSILKFYSHGQFDEMASLETKNEETLPVVSYAQARIGDEVLRELEIQEICAIKIDVEGAELQVIRGLQETLLAKHPPLIFEILPNFYGLVERIMHPPAYCEKNQASADAIFHILTDIGYEIFNIDDKGSEKKISRFELDDRVNYAGNNYIARHRP